MQNVTNSPETTSTLETKPTPRFNKVDTTKVAELSRRISALDTTIAKLRLDIRRTRIRISRGYKWNEVENPKSKRKREKEVLSATKLRDERLKLEEFRFALKQSVYNRVRLKYDHAELILKERNQSRLNRQLLTLRFQAGRDPMGFIKRTVLLLSDLPTEVQSVLKGLPDQYKSEPKQAKDRLLEIISNHYLGTFLTLKEKPTLRSNLFRSFFGETPSVQTEVKA